MKKYNIINDKGKELEIRMLSGAEFHKEETALPHRENFIRSIDTLQYCKAEIFKDCILGTMKVPAKNFRRQEFTKFGFYMTGNTIYLTGGGEFLEEYVLKVTENMPDNAAAGKFFLGLLEVFLEDDVLYLLKMEEEMEAMEELLLSRIPEQFYEMLIGYRKELYSFHAYYEQLMDIGDSMQDYTSGINDNEDAAVWQHFTSRAERLHNHTEMLREYLVQIRELYQTRIDMQQNKVMSFLTVVTTIFMPLTLIAGWYGMNFMGMPELGWKYGYAAIIIVSILIMLCEIIYFSKKKKSWNPD